MHLKSNVTLETGASEKFQEALADHGYFTDLPNSTAILLAIEQERPLLLTGQPGVGKTELAYALGRIYETHVERLQCYEGMTVEQVIAEWDYQRQLLAAQSGQTSDLYDRKYLLTRPIMNMITPNGTDKRKVGLIDEVDKADEDFEAFLLGFLDDYRVIVPELGEISAEQIPMIILTSNETRELGDALRRRCRYLHLTEPGMELQTRIVQHHLPHADPALLTALLTFIVALQTKRAPLRPPGIAEKIDWAAAIVAQGSKHLGMELVRATLGILFKSKQDLAGMNEVVNSGVVNL